ncbi:hypothetical protein D3C81_1863640 [compost metagenome]
MDLMQYTTVLQPIGDSLQAIHRHPRAVCAAATGGTFPGGWRFEQLFVRAGLLHLIKNTAIGGNNQLRIRQGFRRLNQLTG